MNLSMSFRGAERQAPSVLSMALRFSAIMDMKAATGAHTEAMSTEERLRQVVEDFHNTKGMLLRWHLDDTKFYAMLNIIIGTSPALYHLYGAIRSL
jgi:hypothetical protein